MGITGIILFGNLQNFRSILADGMEATPIHIVGAIGVKAVSSNCTPTECRASAKASRLLEGVEQGVPGVDWVGDRRQPAYAKSRLGEISAAVALLISYGHSPSSACVLTHSPKKFRFTLAKELAQIQAGPLRTTAQGSS